MFVARIASFIIRERCNVKTSSQNQGSAARASWHGGMQSNLRQLDDNCAAIRAAQAQPGDGGVWLNPDPELVHKARVALRRLRSTLKFLTQIGVADRDDAFDAELKWLFSCFGAARDWDVFIDGSLSQFETDLHQKRFNKMLQQAARQRQDEAYYVLQHTLGSVRYQTIVASLGVALQQVQASEAIAQRADLPQLAKHLLHRQYSHLQSEIALMVDDNVRQYHRVRIAVKKLRYTSEFLADIFKGKRFRKYAQTLTATQDLLGALNDAAQAGRLLQEVLQSVAAPAALRTFALARFATHSMQLKHCAKQQIVALMQIKKPWRQPLRMRDF